MYQPYVSVKPIKRGNVTLYDRNPLKLLLHFLKSLTHNNMRETCALELWGTSPVGDACFHINSIMIH